MCSSQEILESTLADVNDWLKFAEAKNGALLVLNCALIFGLVRVLLSVDNVPKIAFLYGVLVLIQLLTSLVLTLVSLLPRVKPPWWVKFSPKGENENPLYFGSICKYSPKAYLKIISSLTSAQKSSDLEKYLSQQVVANSKIAYIKYSQFNKAAWLLISACMTPVGAFFFASIKE